MDELAVFRAMGQRDDPPSKEHIQDLVKRSLRHYFEVSSADEIPTDTLKTELSDIYHREMLLSRDMIEWANNELKQYSAKAVPPSTSKATAVAEILPKQSPSIYSPNTLYHASLCCSALVACRDEADAHRFFAGARHRLSQVSFCAEDPSENLDQYLIARNGDVIYVAFRSEAHLSEWLKKYNTFDEGIFTCNCRLSIDQSVCAM